MGIEIPAFAGMTERYGDNKKKNKNNKENYMFIYYL